jgi:hypothetical protein
MTNTAPTTPSAKLQYKQQANPLLSMHNYTPLVIIAGMTITSMQLALVCQRKLALPAQNVGTMKSSEPVKNLKTSHGPNLKSELRIQKGLNITHRSCY